MMRLATNGEDYTRLCEGCALRAYRDSEGAWTIGWGHTGPEVVEGLSWDQGQADAAFERRYAEAAAAAAAWATAEVWRRLDPVRQAALTDMTYQMGPLQDFRQTRAAVLAFDWWAVARVVLANSAGDGPSRYFRQTPNRAARSAYMLLTGQWVPVP